MNYILQNTRLYVRNYRLEVIQLDLWIQASKSSRKLNLG